MARVFVMGDIHGAYKALKQCLERSGFNYEEDTLIQLGDVADGWSEVYECVEELLKIKNLISIKGNHDEWFNEFLKTGMHPTLFQQGGSGTLNSYNNHLGVRNVPQSHIDFFNRQHLYYIDDENRMFVHGGFNRHYTLEENKKTPHLFYWDRDLWLASLAFEGTVKGHTGPDPIKFKMKDDFKEVFIGHTTTVNWNSDKPMKGANVWNLDTGAGFKGKLTIMNVDTKEYFQSDEVSGLYLGEKGRN